MTLRAPPERWSPLSWQSLPAAHQVEYPDAALVQDVVARLRLLPPLVTSWEIERLRELLASAARGEAFLLQAGDCAERTSDCRPDAITGMLKIILQMSLVLVLTSRRPVIRVGRLAGQYAKPRTSPTETRERDGNPVTVPSYYGDLANREEFSPDARRPDPRLMVDAYMHAALTLNFVRALVERGFADLSHPENWELGFLEKAALPEELRARYRAATAQLRQGLATAQAAGARLEALTRVEFFTSHEGLNLHYESAQTR
ncbi:MAG TPA: 3-deoxy-7-phosphoheptulonate synthase, partial [Phycisphaerales bacterium]|nr:3-deoxy-7-phosphoheptulonate synthase [Phycisphaerales bacterium]